MGIPLAVHTLAERPYLWDGACEIGAQVWPEFMQHDPVCDRHWGRLLSDFAEYQLVLCADDGRVVAAAHTVPFAWDGDPGWLPEGFDSAFAAAIEDRESGVSPTALLGLAVVVRPECQHQGIAERVVREVRSLAETKGLIGPVIPIRPVMKCIYPLVPMKRYVEWRRPDGSPFDPWIRLHSRLGARIVHVANRSMVITGTVAEWEQWALMSFPESGAYVVPGALTLVTIDRERDQGEYVEPDVWMLHRGSDR